MKQLLEPTNLYGPGRQLPPPPPSPSGAAAWQAQVGLDSGLTRVYADFLKEKT